MPELKALQGSQRGPGPGSRTVKARRAMRTIQQEHPGEGGCDQAHDGPAAPAAGQGKQDQQRHQGGQAEGDGAAARAGAIHYQHLGGHHDAICLGIGGLAHQPELLGAHPGGDTGERRHGHGPVEEPLGRQQQAEHHQLLAAAPRQPRPPTRASPGKASSGRSQNSGSWSRPRS